MSNLAEGVYQQGYEVGYKEGYEEGRAKGRAIVMRDFMRRNNMTLAEAFEFLGKPSSELPHYEAMLAALASEESSDRSFPLDS